MQDQARVVVIGGGVVGASVLYHLTKHGWSDVMLLERSDLTSGSTWHAAGGMHTINGDPNVAKLQQYTIGLYKEIEELSGQDIGLHMTGGVMLAATQERFDWLKGVYAKGKYLGMDELEIITPERAAELMPLLDPSQFVGALYDPIEGHCDPYGVTHAYAKAARKNGAVVETQTKVESLSQTPDGTWHIETNKGMIRAEHVVNAGGLWAREIGRMVGLELPVLAMEHMYLLTEDMPEVAEFNEKTGIEMLHAVDFDGDNLADIWTNPTDAIGSVANYFNKKGGWKKDQPVATRAHIGDKLDTQGLNKMRRPKVTIAELIVRGYQPVQNFAEDSLAFPMKLTAKYADEYWLGFNNFYAIGRYNPRIKYAMAVYQLSLMIKEQRCETSEICS